MRGHIAAGIGILYALIQVGLIAAKFIGHIHWSWWLVLSPIWAPIALTVIGIVVAIALFADSDARGENPFQ